MRERDSNGQFLPGNKLHKKKRKRYPDLVHLCKSQAVRCVDRLVSIVADDAEKAPYQIAAATALLSYGFGRPRQTTDVNVEMSLSDEYLEALKLVNGMVNDGEPRQRVIDVTPRPRKKRVPKELEHA